MATFHRLTTPGYFGGLPAGYDYINNAVSGTPANANPALTYGPNIGSYYVGFGDPGTSADANRPHDALSTNTDYIDDLLHADLAIPISAPFTSSGGGDTSQVFPINTFVGVPGTPNTPAGILSFAKILDLNGNEIEVNGVACFVASITGATVGTTWSTGSVTFVFNQAVPTGMAYQIWYGIRGNLATLPVDAISNPTIRNTQENTYAFLDLQKQIVQYSGLNVSAIIGTLFETPDGTRLAKSSTMEFAVDPDGSNGGIHSWSWVVSPAGANRTLVSITDSNLLSGLTGALFRGASVGDYFTNQWVVSSAASRTASTSAPYSSNITMTDSTNLAGANMAIWDKAITTAAITGGASTTVMRGVNARWTVSVGDGSTSFGDFNGTSAIANALAFAAANGITTGRILVKSGTYIVNSSGSQIVVPANSDFIIEGASETGALLDVFSGTPTAAITVASGATLHLKNINMQQVSTSVFAVSVTSGSLYMDGVNLNGLSLSLTTPAVSGFASGCFRAKDCFMTAAFGQPVLTVNVNTFAGATHFGDAVTGVVFEDCQLIGANNSPILSLVANSATTGIASITGVRFVRCHIVLGYAGTTGGNLTGNSGVIDVNPNAMSNGGSSSTPFGTAYTNMMYLRDAAWIDCIVQAVSNTMTNQSDILMHLVPWANGTATPSVFVAIGSIVISGGRWEVGEVNNTGDLQTFSPFFCAARNITIENVTFKLSQHGGNGKPTTDMMNCLLGTGHTTAWTDSGSNTVPFTQIWGAVAICPGATQVYDVPVVEGFSNSNGGIQPTMPGLNVRNISITNMARDAGVGELLLNPAPIGNEVDGISVSGYVQNTTGGLIPACRVWVYAIVPAYGYVSNIQVVGTTFTAAFQDQTGGSTYFEHEGIFRITPGGHLTLRTCSISGFDYVAGRTFNSYVLTIPVNTSTLYNPYGLVMDECFCNTPAYTAFIAQSGSTTHPALSTRLYKCDFTSGANPAVSITPDHAGAGHYFSIQNCKLTGYYGGFVLTGAWNSSDFLLIENNLLIATGAGQSIGRYNPTTEPFGTFARNVGSGGSAEFLAQVNSASLTATTRIFGFETGYTVSGTISSASRTFSNGSFMLHNALTLQT